MISIQEHEDKMNEIIEAFNHDIDKIKNDHNMENKNNDKDKKF